MKTMFVGAGFILLHMACFIVNTEDAATAGQGILTGLAIITGRLAFEKKTR